MKQTHILGFEMIGLHRYFDGFAAISVRCLNEVSSQRELADKRSVKIPSMESVFRTLIYVSISFYTRRLRDFRMKIFADRGRVTKLGIQFPLTGSNLL